MQMIYTQKKTNAMQVHTGDIEHANKTRSIIKF